MRKKTYLEKIINDIPRIPENEELFRLKVELEEGEDDKDDPLTEGGNKSN